MNRRGQELLGLRTIKVPLDIVNEVQDHLRECGAAGHEGVGFWAGRREGDVFQVEAALMPPQRGVSSIDGIGVVVAGDDLFRMNVWLHAQRLTLIAQIHSHPGDAYHSSTDDDLAIVTKVGSLSIVVPDFARLVFDLSCVAAYRLEAQGSWNSLTSAELASLVEVGE